MQEEMIASNSASMKDSDHAIRRAAKFNCSVLITGPSGSGKTFTAKNLHMLSNRCRGPFVALNCAAIPEGLFESELVGFVQYAFTGAQRARHGHLVNANGGTLFLDEIGAMPLSAQIKLLHLVEGGSFLPIGAKNEVTVDVRIITATNSDLRKLIREGKFREDLFYRINTMEVNLPSLQNRREDIGILIDHFLKVICEKNSLQRMTVSKRALEALKTYHWPGNIRELRGAIERAIVLCDKTNKEIDMDDLPSQIINVNPLDMPKIELPTAGNLSLKTAQQAMIDALQRTYLEEAMRRTDGNISRAAILLDIDRKYVRELLIKHGMHSSNNGEENK